MLVSWVLGVIGAVAVAVDTVMHVRGVGGFATHPVSTLSLAAAGVATAVIAGRAPSRTGGWLRALAIAIAAYLALGTWDPP